MSFRIIEAKHLQALHEGGKRSSWIAAQMLTNLAPATGIDKKIWCLGVINLNGTCTCNTSIPPLHWTITMSCLVNTKKSCKPCIMSNLIQRNARTWHSSETVSNLEMSNHLLGKETDCKQQQHPLVSQDLKAGWMSQPAMFDSKGLHIAENWKIVLCGSLKTT